MERPAIADVNGVTVVYVGINNATIPGLFAFDLPHLEPSGASLVRDVKSVCTDETSGLVFASYHDTVDYQISLLGAWQTADTAFAWPDAVELDHYLPYGSPPSLGWVQGQPATFVITFDESIYAIHRTTGEVFYAVHAPQAGWSPVTYSGGLSGGYLYLPGSDQRIYVHDADTGQRVHILEANDDSGWREASPAIVDVVDSAGNERGSVVFYRSTIGEITALSTQGVDTLPATYQLSVSAAPVEIGPFSESTITATLVNGNMEPVSGVQIQFSCDAGNNQGYLSSTTAITDTSGQAVTTFRSEKRLGSITITADIAVASPATTTVIVSKPSDDPPPSDVVGAIRGTVYSDGKPARKVPVVLTSADPDFPPLTTNTNPKGAYQFSDLPLGIYWVSASDDTGSDQAEVELTQDAPNAVADLDLISSNP
jgi:hypothetical protein